MQTRFRPGASGTTGSEPVAADGASSPPLVDAGTLAALVDREGVLLMALGVLAALALGAWHALMPGHGKTLMAAAMVGSAARTRQAVVTGVSVAAMHSVSVIGLGAFIFVLEQAFRPEAVYPWLRLASGVVAVDGSPGGHVHAGDGGESHVHIDEVPPEGLLSRRGIAALAFAGGILPSPSALIVLLASIQRGRAPYGLGLVLAFSVGLAVSLVLVGLGLMRARQIVDRHRWARLGRVVPLGAAASVVAIGAVVAIAGIASL
jgi:ABC-type nickel/cobalt efflux system permease component RcnA